MSNDRADDDRFLGAARPGARATGPPSGPIPVEGDVCVRVWLSGVPFDYVTTQTAAHNLIRDCVHKYWCSVELILDGHGRVVRPRLPNERLFLSE